MHEFTYSQFFDRNQKLLAFLAGLPETEVQGMKSDGPLPSPKELHLHPDTYERVWHTLAGTLPEGCRTTVYGHAALQHPPTGLLLAIGFGTRYILRVPSAILEHLKPDEYGFVSHNNKTQRIDLRKAVGPGWIYGRFLEEELGWCRASYQLAAAEVD